MSDINYRVVHEHLYLHQRIKPSHGESWGVEEYLIPQALLDHACDTTAGFKVVKTGIRMDDPTGAEYEIQSLVWFDRDAQDMPTGTPMQAEADPSVEPGALIMESVLDILGMEYRTGSFDEPEALWAVLKELVEEEAPDLYAQVISCGYVADMISTVYDEISTRQHTPFV